jgi:hypothetical protein
MSDYYAHTGPSKSDWQPLREHLEEVARLARLRLDEARPGFQRHLHESALSSEQESQKWGNE